MVDKTSLGLSGGALVIAILAIVTSSGLINSDKTYVCLEPKMALECQSMSKVNAEGLITRCYINTTSFKSCNTGWVKYEKSATTGNIINIGKDSYFLCESSTGLIKHCLEVNGTRELLKISAT